MTRSKAFQFGFYACIGAYCAGIMLTVAMMILASFLGLGFLFGIAP